MKQSTILWIGVAVISLIAISGIICMVRRRTSNGNGGDVERERGDACQRLASFCESLEPGDPYKRECNRTYSKICGTAGGARTGSGYCQCTKTSQCGRDQYCDGCNCQNETNVGRVGVPIRRGITVTTTPTGGGVIG